MRLVARSRNSFSSNKGIDGTFARADFARADLSGEDADFAQFVRDESGRRIGSDEFSHAVERTPSRAERRGPSRSSSPVGRPTKCQQRGIAHSAATGEATSPLWKRQVANSRQGSKSNGITALAQAGARMMDLSVVGSTVTPESRPDRLVGRTAAPCGRPQHVRPQTWDRSCFSPKRSSVRCPPSSTPSWDSCATQDTQSGRARAYSGSMATLQDAGNDLLPRTSAGFSKLPGGQAHKNWGGFTKVRDDQGSTVCISSASITDSSACGDTQDDAENDDQNRNSAPSPARSDEAIAVQDHPRGEGLCRSAASSRSATCADEPIGEDLCSSAAPSSDSDACQDQEDPMEEGLSGHSSTLSDDGGQEQEQQSGEGDASSAATSPTNQVGEVADLKSPRRASDPSPQLVAHAESDTTPAKKKKKKKKKKKSKRARASSVVEQKRELKPRLPVTRPAAPVPRARSSTVPPPRAQEDTTPSRVSTKESSEATPIKDSASVSKAAERVQEHARRALLKAKEDECAREASKRGKSVDLRKSIAKAQGRVYKRMVAESGRAGGSRNSVAIIGAGPVGLWAALLLCRQFYPGQTTNIIGRPIDIDIYEKRPKHKHGTRNILLCFSTQTETVINKALSVFKPLAPSVRLCDLEILLRNELEKFSFVTIHWEKDANLPESAGNLTKDGCDVEYSDDLSIHGKHYDVCFVASGKRSNADRQQIMHNTEATILAYTKGTPDKVKNHADVYTHSILRNANIIIREFDKTNGWVWLLNYQNENIDPSQKYASFKEICAEHRDSILFESLDEAICVTGDIGVTKTATSYWGITKNRAITFETAQETDSTYVCYIGDSCCGKPFYLGTTLQFHIYDMVFLITGIQWNQKIPVSRPHFKAYGQRMRTRIHGFMMKTLSENVPITDVIDAHSHARMRSCSPGRRGSASPTNRALTGKNTDGSPNRMEGRASPTNRTLTGKNADGSPNRMEGRATPTSRALVGKNIDFSPSRISDGCASPSSRAGRAKTGSRSCSPCKSPAHVGLAE